MRHRVCVFDAYGTLFDVDGAARLAAENAPGSQLSDIWPELAANWRRKQLEYTWLRAIMGLHVDFWQVTQDGLDWALDAARIDDAELRATLLSLYRTLPAYGEVPEVLAELRAKGAATAILSNGSPDMLDDAARSAGISEQLDAVLSVETVGIFKPHTQVYDLVGAQFSTAPEEILFVSSNGWDAAGASAYGFDTVWVNRAGLPQDRLPAQAAHVAADLTTIPDIFEVI